VQPRPCSVWSTGLSGVHRTVSGAPGRLGANWPLSGFRRRRTAKIHRTVRCAPDCPVSQRSARANGRPRNMRGTRGEANGRKMSPDCPVCTGHVRCANCARSSNGRQRSEAPVMETNRAPDSVRCAPDCPVPPSTEGQDSLPDLLSTAPSCLGAIKGAPRRMEEIYKQPLSILDHPHSVFAHLFVTLSVSSSVLVRTL
jgi:hypothetical protein